ncbi:hypothetical protein J6590_005937 [Homalodisca vitripennis]|nr:hypothetical protein J6590_005937 [Homalodisca vitripennis]
MTNSMDQGALRRRPPAIVPSTDYKHKGPSITYDNREQKQDGDCGSKQLNDYGRGSAGDEVTRATIASGTKRIVFCSDTSATPQSDIAICLSLRHMIFGVNRLVIADHRDTSAVALVLPSNGTHATPPHVNLIYVKCPGLEVDPGDRSH